MGSAYYIAPEIFKRRYTKSVDVWALGIILYLLLCGEVPFGHTAETESEVYKAIQEQSLHFGSFWNSITSAARELVSGLLQKDSSKRYTIEEALAHPWVAGVAAVDTPMDRALIQGLMSFNNKNKFKKQALKAVASKLSANDVRTLRDAFHKLDTDNTGFITYSELKVALATAGMGGDDEQIDKMMKSVVRKLRLVERLACIRVYCMGDMEVVHLRALSISNLFHVTHVRAATHCRILTVTTASRGRNSWRRQWSARC